MQALAIDVTVSARMMRRRALLVVGAVAIVAAGCGGGSVKNEASSATVPQRTATTAVDYGCTGSTRHESAITYDHLPAVTKAEVDRVREIWAHKYPMAADAIRAGWFKSTPSLYGIGAHYIKDVTGFVSVAKPFDLLHPNILLYDGEGRDARFAGVSYVVAGKVDGFTGCYDAWHSHPSVCIDKERRVTLTEPYSRFWFSEAQCKAHGFQVVKIAADKMIHVWIGPGYTDAPIFAHDNPKLYDGYYPKRRA